MKTREKCYILGLNVTQAFNLINIHIYIYIYILFHHQPTIPSFWGDGTDDPRETNCPDFIISNREFISDSERKI